MDFFEEQDISKRKTGKLIVLFSAAVIFVAASVSLILYLCVSFVYALRHFIIDSNIMDDPGWPSYTVIIWTSLTTLVLMIIGTFYTIRKLCRGGSFLAEKLGGRRIGHTAASPADRKLFNIVEEMAIASGLPTPDVYVLDQETSINAMTAGYSLNDATVIITRGCLTVLNRDELQSVIAHEFAHILSGDTKLNTRLIGFLSGILLFGNIGRHCAILPSRSAVTAIPVIAWIMYPGIALIFIGFGGQLFGRIIQSAVSREREYFADAAAVQFTRNPDGLVSALKKIGGYMGTTSINSPYAQNTSHMFFTSAFSSWFETHPPIAERIRRFDPYFDGEFKKIKPPDADDHLAGVTEKFLPEFERPINVTNTVTADEIIDSVGNFTAEHVAQSAKILSKIPDAIKDELQTIPGSIAVVCGLLLNPDIELQKRQLRRLQKVAGNPFIQHILKIRKAVITLAPELRLPVLDLAYPALKRMSPGDYGKLNYYVQLLIESNSQWRIFEFCLKEIIVRRLGVIFSKQRKKLTYKNFKPIIVDVLNLLVKIADVGHEDKALAQKALNAAIATLPLNVSGYDIPEPQKISFHDLSMALNRFSEAVLNVRKTILEAAAQCVLYDGVITVEEGELIRAIAYALELPFPPFITE